MFEDRRLDWFYNKIKREEEQYINTGQMDVGKYYSARYYFYTLLANKQEGRNLTRARRKARGAAVMLANEIYNIAMNYSEAA